MLRITSLLESETEAVLRVEGRCVGPYVQVLEETLNPIVAQGKLITLEVEDLEYVDPTCAQLLVELSLRGVLLKGCRGFVRLQLGLSRDPTSNA